MRHAALGREAAGNDCVIGWKIEKERRAEPSRSLQLRGETAGWCG